jgi:glutamyl-tRNA synthetase
VRFDDAVHGPCRFDPAAETGDFVVMRADGVAAYQLAVVVDDAAMGITEVVRGDDLLPSTARQLLLYGGLGLPAPRFAHAPLLLGEDGERLAKRSGARSLDELREGGVAPEVVVGWLAQSCGLAPAGTRCRPDELVAGFDWAKVPTVPSRVDAGLAAPR